MVSIERTVSTDQPIGAVFDYLRDFSNAEEWDAGTVSCTLMSGRGGTTGSTYRNVSRFLGRDTELTYTIEQLDEPHLIVVVGRNATVTSTDTIALRPRSQTDGTTVRYHAEFEFHGFARYLTPLLRGPLKQLGNDAEQTLTAALSRPR